MKIVYVYMLQSLIDMRYYVGITVNILERLQKHNRGEISSTKSRKPLKVVYIKEYCSYAEARKHEKWLKKKNREYKDRIAQLAPPEIGGVK